ncbi:MAG: hypothetical protein AAB328_00410, partial [candidate division NC10 bacterium]
MGHFIGLCFVLLAAGAGTTLFAPLLPLYQEAFGLGTGYEGFRTSGLIPTAAVTCALAIGVLRAAYGSFSLEAMKAVGIRRRVVLVGEGVELAQL